MDDPDTIEPTRHACDFFETDQRKLFFFFFFFLNEVDLDLSQCDSNDHDLLLT